MPGNGDCIGLAPPLEILSDHTTLAHTRGHRAVWVSGWRADRRRPADPMYWPFPQRSSLPLSSAQLLSGQSVLKVSQPAPLTASPLKSKSAGSLLLRCQAGGESQPVPVSIGVRSAYGLTASLKIIG